MMSLLDLSSAFDTVEHRIMLQRLERSFGIRDLALRWVTSYFSDRHQYVDINGAHSKLQPLQYGVPQGSIFGPFAFPKYSSPISTIAGKHNVNYHQYADDIQLYALFSVEDHLNSASQLETYIHDIQKWMNRNLLKLNEKKTEFIVIGSKHARHHIQDTTSLTVGDSQVPSVPVARNIGVLMDNKLDMTDHVKSVCKASYAQLRQIA